MSGSLQLPSTQVTSPWLTAEELLAPREFAMRQTRNDLLNQASQQEINATDMEMVSRASAYLDSLPTPEAKAAAWPGVFSTLKSGGFARNMPEGSPYPGDERIKQLAMMGTPSKELYETARIQRALAANQPTPNGLLPPAPGAGTGTTAGTYEGAIGGHEGTGKNPNSTAYGTGQFLESTWLNFAAEHPEMFPNMSQQQILAARSNPALGNTAINWLAQKNAQDLQAAGVTPSGQSLGISHYLGSGAAAKIMQAGDAEPVRNFVSEAAVRANPELATMTVGQMKARYAGTPNPSFMTASAAPSGQRGGVAARTGGTDVAGPPGTVPAAPGSTPAQTTQPQQPPVQQAPMSPAARAIPPPPAVGSDLLTDSQRRTINTEKALARTAAEAAAVVAHQQEYIDKNRAEAEKYRQAVAKAEDDAQQAAERAERLRIAQSAEQRAIEEQDFKRADELRKQQEAIRAEAKAKRDARFTGAPTGYEWSEDGKTLVQSPGFQGTDKDERLDYRLDHGDPNSAQYAADYAAKKWQVSQQGNVIENDMSMYRPPAIAVQRPTYLPQPTPQSLEDVRKVSLDADTTVQAIDNYLKVLGETDGGTLSAFFSNPRDPKAQKLLGAFDAMKMAMRGPSAMNTGVLQPAEMQMLREDLISPQTVRGLTGTPEAAGARLGQIKLTLLRKWDAELRSVGKDGILVRTVKQHQALPSGTVYYDEDGNRRTKE